jgi:hypothetical protein
VGAAALAIGFASPALAAQNINNGNAANAKAQNYIAVQGGSNTTYLVMQGLSTLFDEATGCDTVGQSSAEQPLNYACAGLNSQPGLAQPAAQVDTFTGVSVTAFSKTITIAAAIGNTDIAPGTQITDSGNKIPEADPVTAFNSSTGAITLQFAAKGSSTSDTVTANFNPQQGENGAIQWGQDNPFNDILVQEPSYGSGNGILELEGSGSATVVGHSNSIDDPAGTGPVPVTAIDSARSSRAPKLAAGGDFQGMNFVAYAEDAVDYNYWTSFNGNPTDASTCLGFIGASNITTAMLKTIWNETYTGGVPSVTWQSLDPGAPLTDCPNTGVYAYWSQSGSGTESTWASATGATFPTSASNWPAKQIIFENETTAILGNGATAPVGDVISFFSYGAYSTKCKPNLTTTSSNYLQSTTTSCTGVSTVPSVPNVLQLGTLWNNIQLNPTAINDQLPGLTGSMFPGDRLIYNVYSDGSNANIPVTNPAALNVVSEDGFVCKPATSTDVDGLTGLTYRTEITNILKANGFLPLPNLQIENGQGDTTVAGYNSTATGIPHPAWTDGLSASKYNAALETGTAWKFAAANLDTDNSAISGTYSGVEDGSATLRNFVAATPTNPIGYCITESTDASLGGT